MQKLWIALLALAPIPFAPFAFAESPRYSHSALTRQLEDASGHAKKMRSEVSKAKHMNPERMKQELVEFHAALKAAESTYQSIARESPGDANEGHFLSLGAHRESAARAASRLQDELGKKSPNYTNLKKLAKTLVNELEEAKYEHGLELHEMERP